MAIPASAEARTNAGYGLRLDVAELSPVTIAAALSWYDEPVDFLYRCVTSLEGFADELIAVDGPWEGFPAESPSSPREQAEAITAAASAIGLPVTIHDQQATWASQVGKRSWLMNDASDRADWVFVIDGDEWLSCDAEVYARTREQLEPAELDVATVRFRNVCGSNQTPAPIRRIYRAPVTVSIAHHGYHTPDGRWLHGSPGYVKLEPTLDLPIELLHEPVSRGEARNRAATRYREHRRRTQAERWRTPA